jgi:preprotein translocase subunit SecA
LFGRCARQGDPGSAQAIVALDDSLFVDHGGALHARLRRLFPHGLPPPAIGLLVWHVQRRAQRMHARTRRDTMKQDRRLDTMLSFAGNQV